MIVGCFNKRIRVITVFLIIFTLSLIIFPSYTSAQDPQRDYGAATTTTLQRMLDAWDKGPFCASCHKLSYPLPPEKSFNTSVLTREPRSVAIDMEPNLERLTYDTGRDVGAFYSPSGDRIVWVTDRLGNWTIWSMNPDGSDKKLITPNDLISGWPSWSPDGKEIAYWSWDIMSGTGDIWTMKADGSAKAKLTTDGSFKGPPMWSPRGDRIAYTSNLTGNIEVYVINIDGHDNRQITTGHSPKYSVETRVTWHPDGERLYYQALTFPIPERTYTIIPGDVAFVEIFMINVDAGYEYNLTPKLHENVRSVSPDGEKMACISLRSNNYGVWIMNADGTDQTRLTWDGFGDRAPHFSPDSQKIVYWSTAHANQPDIWMINQDGSGKTRLTTSLYQDVYPSWSPDGKKIIFESDRAGNFDIWQKTLDEPIKVNLDYETWATPGSVNKASLTVKLNDPNNEIELQKIALRPDWETEEHYIDYSESLPTTLTDSNGTQVFTLNIDIPEDVELGYHFYDVRVEYSEVVNKVSSQTRIYDCTGGDLEIDHYDRTKCAELNKIINDELTEVHKEKINESIAQGEFSAEMVEPLKGYLDFLVKPEAEYFLKANDEYYKAVQLRRSGRYSEAVNRFKGIEGILVGQQPELDEANNNGIMIVYTLIPLAAIVIAVTLMIRRRKAD
ncbi:MAG: DPP IV N-terminal domain-containing protein [Nitrosomonadaceae bacterium]